MCVKGICIYICKVGLFDCNNWLNDGCEFRLLYNDDLCFCGFCIMLCFMDLLNVVFKCIRGVCGYICNFGWVNCDNNWKNGCECFVIVDLSNCGVCGKKCLKLML